MGSEYDRCRMTRADRAVGLVEVRGRLYAGLLARAALEARMTTSPTDPPPADRHPTEAEVSALLSAVVGGEPGADAELLRVFYSELRAIAGAFFKDQKQGHTLQPTALVHEAFMKLSGGRSASWESRAHFIAVAARAMRQVLIDHARHKRAEKRGGHAERVTLSGLMSDDAPVTLDALDVDRVLHRLAEIDSRQARVVEMRFFADLKTREIAQVLGVSERTVELDWRLARAWLRRALEEEQM